uniref:Putative secreted protein n=1 Tax=Anopheles darlingi TaxID=43151 RepID=A0A2M4DH74_ANODA
MVWARSVNFRSLLALLVGEWTRARAIIRRAILISTCKERERESAISIHGSSSFVATFNCILASPPAIHLVVIQYQLRGITVRGKIFRTDILGWASVVSSPSLEG